MVQDTSLLEFLNVLFRWNMEHVSKEEHERFIILLLIIIQVVHGTHKCSVILLLY